MPTDPQIRAQNEAVINGLTSDNPFIQKEAANGVNDYLRIRAREDGFARRIQPPVAVTPADLDRQVDTVKPVIVKTIFNPPFVKFIYKKCIKNI